MRNQCGLACLIWLAVAQTAAATESVDCARLEDAQERLACYDAKFPRPAETPPPLPPAPTERAPTPPPAAPAAITEPAPAGDASGSATESKKGGLFGDEKVDLTSTITAILAGEKQKMVFQLANEQIWIQSTPRPLPFKVGDTVTIRNATLGGYFMRTSKGTSTRVQRIH